MDASSATSAAVSRWVGGRLKLSEEFIGSFLSAAYLGSLNQAKRLTVYTMNQPEQAGVPRIEAPRVTDGRTTSVGKFTPDANQSHRSSSTSLPLPQGPASNGRG